MPPSCFLSAPEFSLSQQLCKMSSINYLQTFRIYHDLFVQSPPSHHSSQPILPYTAAYAFLWSCQVSLPRFSSCAHNRVGSRSRFLLQSLFLKRWCCSYVVDYGVYYYPPSVIILPCHCYSGPSGQCHSRFHHKLSFTPFLVDGNLLSCALPYPPPCITSRSVRVDTFFPPSSLTQLARLVFKADTVYYKHKISLPGTICSGPGLY